MGRYFTPRSASGIRATIIRALKITAERIALAGVCQPHDVQPSEHRIRARERRRDDGEILRHVVGQAEGGQRPAGHQQLLADLDDLDQLGRDSSRDRPCCRPLWRPACRCSSPRPRRPGPRRANRSCRRRSWPPGGRPPGTCGSAPSFASGVAWARKSSTPASAAMAAAVSGLSPVIITV